MTAANATRPKLTRIRLRLAASTASSPAASTTASQKAGIPGPWEGGPSTRGAGGVSVRAVVLTVTVACTGLVPSGVTEEGDTEHVVPERPEGNWQLRSTGALNPAVGVTVTEYCTGVPAKAVSEGVELESEKSEPPPESAIT